MPFTDLLSSPKINHKYHFKTKTIYFIQDKCLNNNEGKYIIMNIKNYISKPPATKLKVKPINFILPASNQLQI